MIAFWFSLGINTVNDKKNDKEIIEHINDEDTTGKNSKFIKNLFIEKKININKKALPKSSFFAFTSNF